MSFFYFHLLKTKCLRHRSPGQSLGEADARNWRRRRKPDLQWVCRSGQEGRVPGIQRENCQIGLQVFGDQTCKINCPKNIGRLYFLKWFSKNKVQSSLYKGGTWLYNKFADLVKRRESSAKLSNSLSLEMSLMDWRGEYGCIRLYFKQSHLEHSNIWLSKISFKEQGRSSNFKPSQHLYCNR